MKTTPRRLVLVLALAAALLSGSVARAIPPSHCTLFPGGGVLPNQRLGAQETKRFDYSVPAGTDSVSGNATVDGYPAWAVFWDNHGDSSVNNPRVTMSSGLDPAVFDGALPTQSFPTSCSLPSLGAGQQLQIFPDVGATGIHSSFRLGYDSSRSVSPSVVPVGGGDVTATFTVKLIDPSYAGGWVSLFIDRGGPVTLLSQSGPDNLDQGENLFTSPGSWNLGGLQLGKTYVFTAVVHVDNPPFGQLVGPWTWTPGAQIYVSPPVDGCSPCGAGGPSITIPDPSLDGSQPGSGGFTFAVDEANRLWDVAVQSQYVTLYRDGFYPDLNAQVNSIVATTVPASTDSVASGTILDGHWGWDFDIGNFQLDNTVTNPSISVASGYDAAQLQPDFGSPASSLPIVRSAGSLASGSDLRLGLGSMIPTTVQPGCDTSRSVTPLVVPVGGGQQTMTFTIRCDDPAGTNVNGGFSVGVPGATLVSFVPPSNLGDGEGLNGPPDSWFGGPGDAHAGFGFGVENLQPDKQYTFTFVVQTPNPFGVAFVQKPQVGIQEELPQPTGCLGCGGPQTSVAIAMPTLDGPTAGAGSVTLSAGEPHIWAVHVRQERKVDYGSTQQRDLGYAGPSSAVDGQAVALTAVWGGGQGQPGTPVSFTLGSQSCTAVTGTIDNPFGDRGATCTIALAQPVGTVALNVSSPGDVSVYPASTSVSFSITGPTTTAQCKAGGWKVFRIFKTQGDCVSYVATNGNNPAG